MLKARIPINEPDFVHPPKDFTFTRVDSVSKTGVRISQMEKKEFVRNYDQFTARDFQLQELIESGAVDLLKPTSAIAPDKLYALDASAVAASRIDEFEKSHIDVTPSGDQPPVSSE